MEDTYSELLSGEFPCCASEVEGKKACSSSDALRVYRKEVKEDEVFDAYCFSCSQTITVKQFAETELGKQFYKGEIPASARAIKPKEKITREQAKELWGKSGFIGKDLHGIRDETFKFYGQRIQLDSVGNPHTIWYPETQGGKLFGYKPRELPKNFRIFPLGWTGVKSDLAGQHKFTNGGKYVLIVGGEKDMASAFQMLRDMQVSRGNDDYDPVAVVSPTTGEGSAKRQIAAQYEFLDTFGNIVIGMDNDDAGHEATEAIIEVLPKDKVKIATWSLKDPNQMLQEGKERQFLRDFYGAKEIKPPAIKSSSDLMEDVYEVLTATKITLPSYMKVLEANMRRAFSTAGRVVNIIAHTSVGKSSHTNNMVYHWCMEENIKPLVISLESTAGEYMLDMLSIHLEKNLGWFTEGQEAVEYLEDPEVKQACEGMLHDEYGEERFRIVDERDGKIATIERQIEQGVKQYGCNLVVIDVLSDILRFLPTDEQEKHMLWQKMFVKQGISIVNVLHTKKAMKDKNGKYMKATEYDALGTGSFVQSAHINIVYNRDKMATDPVEQNTTEVDMPKCRGGTTGPAGKWVYDPETRTIMDSEDYAIKVAKEVQGTVEATLVNVSSEAENIFD